MSKGEPVDPETRDRIEVGLELDSWREEQSASRGVAYLKALRDELEHLWDDLAEDYRMSRANPPEQSMGCLGRIDRIQTITKLVGPCPPESVPMPFLLAGVYEKVHAEIGIEATISEDTLRSAREYVAESKRRAG